jgi:hypothetical protein
MEAAKAQNWAVEPQGRNTLKMCNVDFNGSTMYIYTDSVMSLVG